MTWLFPALLTTSTVAIVVALVYFYLYVQDREKFLLLWGFSWTVFSIRFVAHLAILEEWLPPSAFLLQEGASILACLLFIHGSYNFHGKEASRWWNATGFACLVWTAISYVNSFSFLVTHIPASMFAGGSFVWVGYCFLKQKHVCSTGVQITSYALILWGIHRADYPFLRPVAWFAPWGYLFASVLFLIIALGVLLVYFERIRRGLQKSSDELRKSEEKYRTLLETLPQKIFHKDINSVFLSCNEHYAGDLGIQPDEIAGTTDYDFYSRELAEKYRADDQRIMSSGRAEEIEELYTQDGEELIVQTVKTPVLDAEGRVAGVLGIFWDITERKRAEDARLTHFNFLSNMQRVNQVIQRATDVDMMMSDTLDEVLDIFGSDQAWLLFPCDPNTPSFRIPMERTRPEYPGALAQDLEIRMEPGAARDCREALNSGNPITCTNGTDAPVAKDTAEHFQVQAQMFMAIHPKVGLPWLFGLHQCSHARVWTEAEQTLFKEIGRRMTDGLSSLLFLRDLRESEERYRNFVVNASEGIYRIDFKTVIAIDLPDDQLESTISKHAVVGEVNEALAKMYGLCPEDMVGRLATDFSPEYGKRALLAIRTPQHEVQGVETLDVGRNGQPLHLLESYTAVVKDGCLVRIWGMQRDLTEHKRLEEQLRQAQKMEAVGQLAGGIAHDFNNILQGIMGYAEMAKMNLTPEGQVYQDIEQLEKGAVRAATLTQQLLAFSRRQMIKPVDLNLNDVIAGVSKMLRRVIGEHIELELKLGAETKTVHADPGTLEQILLNLCVNARDAMPDGGQLAIETEHVVLDDGFVQTHPWAIPGEYALVSVTDSGVGMSPDVVKNVFEPFFTTKEPGKGTGLGLSMVYGIVKQHEGLIHCYSEPGKGSRFEIHLPSIERAAETNETAHVAPTPQVAGTETILLAEDDETVRRLAVLTLKRKGYRVLVAEDGEEALRLFAEHRESIQFALLDVVMPRVGGREVYDAIRAQKPDMPVLFSSGYNTDAIHMGFVVDEGLETIQKPYSPKVLLQRIRQMLSTK